MDPFDSPEPGRAPAGEPKRDRYGRYLLPGPGGGKEQAWTRATTFAKSISDSFGLTNWQLRMAVKGVAARPDLYALAASAPVDDKATLDRVAKDAKEAAAASSGANLGTAIHTFTERLDSGEQVTVPAQWAADVESYRDALAAARVEAVPAWIERIVVVPRYRVAGTLDRIVRLADGRLAIADLKTGKDLSYGWLEIAIQLALYANAEAMWDPAADRYVDMPPVDRNEALVMHTPVGQGRTTLHRVDIVAGWEAADLVGQVRQWRTRRDLATAWPAASGADAAARLARVHGNNLLARVGAAASLDALTALWRDNQATWTPEHTAAAAARKAALTPATGR